jgi:hypothetical protein
VIRCAWKLRKKLANDTNLRTEQALVKAASNKNWKVRLAASALVSGKNQAR